MSSTPKFFDRMMESSSTTGTGSYTLAGAITGYQSFAGLGDGSSAYYCAMDVDANGNPSGGWEVGIGTYTASGTTFSRDTILTSTNSNAAVSWAAGARRIFVTVPAAYTPSPDSVVGGVTLTGTKYVHVFNTNLSTGHNDIYTVPAGRKALFQLANVSNMNPATGSVGVYLELKVSGSYYRIRNTTTVTTTTPATQFTATPIVLLAGESLSINCATNAGLNTWAQIIEFDAACPLTIAKKLAPSTGDNTVYTVPAGKMALIGLSLAAAAAAFGNDSGGARTVKTNVVPSGGTVSTTNQQQATSSVANAGVGGLILGGSLSAGDFININVDTGDATCIFWVPIIEIAAPV